MYIEGRVLPNVSSWTRIRCAFAGQPDQLARLRCVLQIARDAVRPSAGPQRPPVGRSLSLRRGGPGFHHQMPTADRHFVLGLSSPLMLAQAAHLAHNRPLSMDATFGMNDHKARSLCHEGLRGKSSW